MALVADIDVAETSEDKVTLMTLHSAKGLEFPLVIMAGMEEGIFPHARTMMNESEIEEERRLCYVGVTRARQQLYITNARLRTIYGTTVVYPESRFLREIPEELLDRQVVQQAVKQDRYSQVLRPAPSRPTSALPGISKEPVAPERIVISDWKAGDKVEHTKWGGGTVVEVRGKGDDLEVKVAFPGMGIRQLMVKFAPLNRI